MTITTREATEEKILKNNNNNNNSPTNNNNNHTIIMKGLTLLNKNTWSTLQAEKTGDSWGWRRVEMEQPLLGDKNRPTLSLGGKNSGDKKLGQLWIRPFQKTLAPIFGLDM
jgi:hypothetical protein